MMSGPPGTEIFISSDMFFLEVLLEPSGLVRDVKIHHEGKSEQQVSTTDVTFMSLLFIERFYCNLENHNFENHFCRAAKRLRQLCRAATLLILLHNLKDWHRYIS